MDILVQAGQLILSLSFLIVLHELGHFIPAKLFKTRVEKFYLFFDWKFSLWKTKKGDTEYGIGWIPLGGYVKISGMIDESMDTDQMKEEPKPYEFRSKPVWQRLIIMVGGVTVNLIVAFIIYSMIIGIYGTDKLPPENMTYGYHVPDHFKKQYGMQDGDIITEVNGEPLDDATDINQLMLVRTVENMKVKRTDGSDTLIKLPEDIEYEVFQKQAMFAPRVPPFIDTLDTKMAAAKAGVLDGDKILAVNDSAITYWHEAVNLIQNSKTDEITLTVLHPDGSKEVLAMERDNKKRVGIQNFPSRHLELIHTDYSFFASIPAGIGHGWSTLKTYATQLKFLFTKKGAESVGGFGAFGSLFSTTWDWQVFWERTALISVILAFMNILPIPALDGGHVMFLLYEMIAGRPPNQKFLEYAQMVGFIIILGLVLYANGNDIIKALQ